MTEEEFRRVVVNPYWCDGSPLAWTTPENIGISKFAEDGKVGLFNLSWWLLNRREPPTSADAYRNTNIMWAIMVAPSVLLGGLSLEHYASVMAQVRFEEMLLARRLSLQHRVEKQGMKWETLQMLASRRSTSKGTSS